MSIGESVRPVRRIPVARAAWAVLLLAGCESTREARVEPASSWLAKPAESAPPPAHALSIRFAGLDALLADPRDAGLRRALGMLDDRLIELPQELGKPVPPGILELAVEIVSQPWELTADLEPGWDGTGPPPLRAQLTIFCKDAEAAQSLYARIAPFSVLAPFRSELVAGHKQLKTMEMPAGKITFGTPEGSDRFLFAWGEPMLDAPAQSRLGLPAGVAPALALEADLGKVSGTLEALLAREEDAGPALPMLRWLGFIGEHPWAVSVAVGHGPDRAQVVTRYRNWKKITARQGSLAAEPLTSAELGRVPADATMAWLGRFDPLCFVDLLDLLADRPGGPPRDEIEAALGLDLEADVFGALGQTFGLYMSDTTGGGGLASLVAFAAVEDETRLEATLAKGIDALREATREEVEGRFAIRDWEHAGAKCRSLSFPSIPVPFEISLASSDGFLLLAATPAGLVAALDQARGDAPGLADHAALRGLGAETLEGLQAIQVTDTPRLLAAGYGLASLVSSAIANGVRSRTDAEREPGLVLPLFHELEAGSRPSVWLSRIQGDDLVVQGECDGSLVANGTAWLGGPGATVLPLAIAASAAVPAFMGVRHAAAMAAPQTQAYADIAAITHAIDSYAAQNQGRYPDSLEDLIVPDVNGYTYLDRDTVPHDPWGRPYQYEPPTAERADPRIYSLGPDGAPSDDDVDLDEMDFDFEGVDSEG